jgi:hypothetical protein
VRHHQAGRPVTELDQLTVLAFLLVALTGTYLARRR